MHLRSSINRYLIVIFSLIAVSGCSEAPVYYGKSGRGKQVEKQPPEPEPPPSVPISINLVPPVYDFNISRITSGFGLRQDSRYNYKEFHKGIDIKLQVGDPVMASAPGNVSFAGNKRGYGKVIILDHGNRIYTVYAHLSSINCRKGDYVERREVIGRGGESGNATGSHLHFEIRESGKAVNPLPHLDY